MQNYSKALHIQPSPTRREDQIAGIYALTPAWARTDKTHNDRPSKTAAALVVGNVCMAENGVKRINGNKYMAGSRVNCQEKPRSNKANGGNLTKNVAL